MFTELLSKVQSNADLSKHEAEEFLGYILDDDTVTESDVATALTALTDKGARVDEIIGFIAAMRARMNKVDTNISAIDTCGTGGDKSNSFNISTASSIVVSACGVPVAKHGNRSATSKCGGADVLEALGIPIDSTPNTAADSLKNNNFVFLFAQKYHPALKKLAIVRKSLGFPTIFNLLGPLLNPAGVKRQVIGTFNLEKARLLADVVSKLGYDHCVVLTSEDGLDEASIAAPTHIFDIRGSEIAESTIKPEDFGLERADKSELVGGDSEQNATIIKIACSPSQELSAKQRVVVLNAGIAIYVAGRVNDINDGIVMASECIQSGKAKQQLERLQS